MPAAGLAALKYLGKRRAMPRAALLAFSGRTSHCESGEPEDDSAKTSCETGAASAK